MAAAANTAMASACSGTPQGGRSAPRIRPYATITAAMPIIAHDDHDGSRPGTRKPIVMTMTLTKNNGHAATRRWSAADPRYTKADAVTIGATSVWNKSPVHPRGSAANHRVLRGVLASWDFYIKQSLKEPHHGRHRPTHRQAGSRPTCGGQHLEWAAVTWGNTGGRDRDRTYDRWCVKPELYH